MPDGRPRAAPAGSRRGSAATCRAAGGGAPRRVGRQVLPARRPNGLARRGPAHGGQLPCGCRRPGRYPVRGRRSCRGSVLHLSHARSTRSGQVGSTRAEGPMRAAGSVRSGLAARVRSSRSGARGPGRGDAPVASASRAVPARTVRACAGDARPSRPVARPVRPVARAVDGSSADTERSGGAPADGGWGTAGRVTGGWSAVAHGAGVSRPGRAPVTRRRACLGTPGLRTRARRRAQPTRAERALVGVAVTLCSATVVVVLGLVADLSADAHSAPPAVSTSISR
ncbi:hypothetical protein EV378_1060 [Pseudonocardia endophytica]|uniref:Uncharacterized protein n=1 Tax=Pseudonocardia endophytica TaxID=401976 RepID=A0A4R1HRN6_PSEEN|nr:hypothetical protein EV378_1060 [Pseudonocardia endophytica]